MRINSTPPPLFFKAYPGILQNEEFLDKASMQIAQGGEVRLDYGYGAINKKIADEVSKDDEFWHRLHKVDGIPADFSRERDLGFVYWIIPTLHNIVVIKKQKLGPLESLHDEREVEVNKENTKVEKEQSTGVFNIEGYYAGQVDILEKAYKHLKENGSVTLKREEEANPSESYSITITKEKGSNETVIDFRALYQVQCDETLPTLVNFLLDNNETVNIIYGKGKIDPANPILDHQVLKYLNLNGGFSYREEYRNYNWSKYIVVILKRDEGQLT